MSRHVVHLSSHVCDAAVTCGRSEVQHRSLVLAEVTCKSCHWPGRVTQPIVDARIVETWGTCCSARGLADPRSSSWHARQGRNERDAERGWLELAAWAAGQGGALRSDVELWLARAGGQHLQALLPVLARIRAAEITFEEVRARHHVLLQRLTEEIARYAGGQARAPRLRLVDAGDIHRLDDEAARERDPGGQL